MRPLRHVATLLTTVLVVVTGGLLLTSCGSSDGDKAPAASSGTKTIKITFEGDSVTPNGDRVEVAVGQQVEFDVTADAPGEIHVHSDPEKELEYQKGTTILKLGSFDKAGIIEVESHHLEKTIVQLEVK
jgi:plastocyanin